VLDVAELHLPRYVRKLLMDEAYRRLMSVGRRRGIIASTDGDTKVANTWVAATIHEIDSGVDAVGGRILTDRHSRERVFYKRLGIDRRSPTFGRLCECVTQHQQQHCPLRWQPIDIQTAISDLRQQLARFDRRAV
jgi:hypothetical protein